MRNRGEKFGVWLHFNERADRRDFLKLRIVLENLLGVVFSARSDFDVADDRRPISGSEGERERGNGVERLKNVSLSINDGATERGIEIMFLNEPPGNEFVGLVIAAFQEEELRDAVFDFAGVAQGGVGIEADEALEIVDAADVAKRDVRLDGVLVAMARLVLFERCAIEEAFQRWRADFQREFSIVARDRLLAQIAGGIERRAVAGCAHRAGRSNAKPGAEVEWNRDARREFRPLNDR